MSRKKTSIETDPSAATASGDGYRRCATCDVIVAHWEYDPKAQRTRLVEHENIGFPMGRTYRCVEHVESSR